MSKTFDWRRKCVVAVSGVLAAVLLAAGIAPRVLAQASEPSALESVKIWVNPEYDDPLKIGRPALLVMIEGEIVGPQPPVDIRFLVPTASQMYSAGSKNSFGEYKGGPPNRTASSVAGYDEVSYQLTENIFRLEYYTPVAQLGEVQKSFSYEFLRLYPVQDLSVTVQQPRNSDNFTVSPPGSANIDTAGFSVQTYKFTNLDASTSVKFSISYARSAWEPSLTSAPIQSPGTTKTGSSSTTGLVVTVVAIAAVLGGGGAYLTTRSGKRSRPKSRAERRRRKPAACAKTKASTGVQAFCSQCGVRLEKPSRFCPDCGSEI